MRLRAIAGLLTLSLAAGACAGAGGDGEPVDAPGAAQQLPATDVSEEIPDEDLTDSTMIPTTTLANYPSAEDVDVLNVGAASASPAAYLDRSTQIDVIQELVTAQVRHEWDTVYAMATPANQSICPRDKFNELTGGMTPRDVEVAFGEMKISQGADAVYADFDLIASIDELPIGFRVASAPELMTNRVVPETDIEKVLGDLTAEGVPHEMLVVEAYGIEGVAAHVGGQILAIEGDRLMMAENPCLVAELASKTTGGLSMWVYPAIEEDTTGEAAATEGDSAPQ